MLPRWTRRWMRSRWVPRQHCHPPTLHHPPTPSNTITLQPSITFHHPPTPFIALYFRHLNHPLAPDLRRQGKKRQRPSGDAGASSHQEGLRGTSRHRDQSVGYLPQSHRSRRRGSGLFLHLVCFASCFLFCILFVFCCPYALTRFHHIRPSPSVAPPTRHSITSFLSSFSSTTAITTTFRLTPSSVKAAATKPSR